MEDIRIDGLSADEWEALANPQAPSNQELEQLGIIQQGEQQEQTPEGSTREYEELSVGETLGDMITAAGVEMSKAFIPKSKEWNYTPRTKAAEITETITKYGWGLVGVGKVGLGLKALGGLAKGTQLGKGLTGASKLIGGDKLFKTSKTGFKAFGVAGANIATQGAIQGGILDWTLTDPYEGRLADLAGDTDNTFVQWLQTDYEDSELEARFKNVVEGAVLGMGVNAAGQALAPIAKPIMEKLFNNMKKLNLKKTATEAEAKITTDEILADQKALNDIATTADLAENVKAIKEEADDLGLDASQLVVDRINPKQIEEAQSLLKVYQDGEEPFIHADGTWDIRVTNSWEDAYKVSPEEYKRQLREIDPSGNLDISHMNESVKSTWTNRGWVGANEELNQTNANKIANNYKDKWQIDNKVKVEFVDGLTINGNKVDGNTSATTYQGKTTKTKQNAIDKKKLQITKLEDKITQLEGGNKEVADPLDNLKEELRTAKNELKELEKSAAGKDKISNITIQIDKNTADPYAVLRSELEHARDIAKGEVPKDSTKHFARYEGENEAEIAGGYVHKKATAKAQKTGFDTALTEPEQTLTSQTFMNDGNVQQNVVKSNIEQNFDKWYNDKNSTATIGELVNHEAFSNGKYLDDVLNVEVGHTPPQYTSENELLAGTTAFVNGKLSIQVDTTLPPHIVEECIYHEIGHIRQIQAALDAHLEGDGTLWLKIKEHNNKVWNKEYKTFEEYASNELEVDAENTKYFLKDIKEQYEQQKAKPNNDIDTRGSGTIEQRNETPFSDSNTTTSFDAGAGTQQGRSRGNSVSKSDEQPQQLKLDFNSIEDINKVEIKSTDDLTQVINKTIELEPEISGTTFEALAKDADKLAKLYQEAEELGLYDDLMEAINLNDVNLINGITRKVTAAQKLASIELEKMAALPIDTPVEQIQPLVDMIDLIGRYTKETGSAEGTALGARRFVNRAVQTFGSLRLSTLTKDGIQTLTDLLDVEIKKLFNLNFTRNQKMTPQEMKEALYSTILTDADDSVYKAIFENQELAQEFDKTITKLLSSGQAAPARIYKELETIVTKDLFQKVKQATDLTDNPANKKRTIWNWCDEQGGLTSYYVHNLLSGVGTLAKNVVSGGMNTLYFPLKKIVASYLGGGEALTREGVNTIKHLQSNWKESWNLCKQAFLNGEGKLTNVKDTMNLNEDEVFKGFRQFDFNDTSPEGIWHSIQNFHSLMTRAMGASDEFMTQLNYRSIMRAKAIETAEQWAKANGIADENVINKAADTYFEKAFDSSGKPMNIEALAEARDILYQLPLNGQMFDPKKGETTQVRETSVVTDLAGSLNKLTSQHAFLKIMFPFVKTGANILQMNLEHNGMYVGGRDLFNYLTKKQQSLLFANTKEGALARSQVAMGMFSFITATSLALTGNITGSAPADPKERKALFETGWKPYSFRVGDKFISYQGYEPIQTVLGFAADSVNIYGNITNSEDEKKWERFSQQVMATTVNNFLDKAAFRTGLRQMALITDPDGNTEGALKALAQTAQGFLLNTALVRNASSLGKREITQPQGLYERLLNNYFNRGLGDYRRDVFGHRQDTYGLLVTNASTDNSNMPEYEELERLSQYGFNPSEISKTISGTTFKYTEFKNKETGRSAYDAMQEELSTLSLGGKTLQEAVGELVTSPEYELLPDGVNMNGVKYSTNEPTKINAIRDLFIEYNEAALNSVVETMDSDFVDKQGRTMSEAVRVTETMKEEGFYNSLTTLY